MASERTVIVLHEGWGCTDDIVSVVRRFEDRGFGVLVPDLFGGIPAGRALVAVPGQLRAGGGPMFDAARQAFDGIGSTPAAVVGLSLGAAIALRIRTRLPVVAAYGHVPRQVEASGPILGVFGRADLPLRRSGRRLEACPTADVRWFDGAGHSFLVDPRVGIPVRFPGVGPHRTAADAWSLIEAFVDRHTVLVGH